MERAGLVWDQDLAAYDLGAGHPLDPRRLRLSVQLMEAFGLLGSDVLIPPRRASSEELLAVHAIGYMEAVQEASDWGVGLRPGAGLGTEDNPIYPGMHELAALSAGASVVAVAEVVEGRRRRSFSLAGGMHHAHKARAAGFSVYNDAAVAIAAARRAHPDLRVLYVDIDAHHGDGVQEAFYGSSDVMTVSVHESGVYAYPGTGFPSERGYGDGEGFSANVPMPARATDACFSAVFDRIIAPLARAFQPGLVVAQVGVDAHHSDPIADLALTLPGYRRLVSGILELAEELCEGRLVALGGGGYNLAVVPLAWTWVMAALLGREIGESVPEEWRRRAAEELGGEAPSDLGAGDRLDVPREREEELLAATEQTIADVQRELFALHGLA